MELSELERETGALGAFVRGRVVAEAEATAEERAVGAPTTGKLYDEYAKFCREWNLRAKASGGEEWIRTAWRKSFTRRFKAVCPEARYFRTTEMVDGKVVHVDKWKGIRLRAKPIWADAEVEVARMGALLKRFERDAERLRKKHFIDKDNEEVREVDEKIREIGEKIKEAKEKLEGLKAGA